jgi:hypothetical protein
VLIQSVGDQLRLLLLSAAFGAGLGLLYDVFRVLRRSLSGRWSAALDAVFAAAAGLDVFWFGMGPGGGVVQVFTAAFIGLGFASYMAYLSRAVMKILTAAVHTACRLAAGMALPVKKVADTIKKRKKFHKTSSQTGKNSLQ